MRDFGSMTPAERSTALYGATEPPATGPATSIHPIIDVEPRASLALEDFATTVRVAHHAWTTRYVMTLPSDVPSGAILYEASNRECAMCGLTDVLSATWAYGSPLFKTIRAEMCASCGALSVDSRTPLKKLSADSDETATKDR